MGTPVEKLTDERMRFIQTFTNYKVVLTPHEIDNERRSFARKLLWGFIFLHKLMCRQITTTQCLLLISFKPFCCEPLEGFEF